MGRKGRFSAQMARISLWAQLMPGEWSLEYTCQVWFGSVYEQPRNNNFKKMGQNGPFLGPRGRNRTLGSVNACAYVSSIYLSIFIEFCSRIMEKYVDVQMNCTQEKRERKRCFNPVGSSTPRGISAARVLSFLVYSSCERLFLHYSWTEFDENWQAYTRHICAGINWAQSAIPALSVHFLKIAISLLFVKETRPNLTGIFLRSLCRH